MLARIRVTCTPLYYTLRYNWSNAEFQSVLVSDPSYAEMEASWVRQAEWGLDDAVAALGSHPLATTISDAWDQLQPAVPNTTGLKFLTPADLAGKPVFPAGR